VAGGKDDLVVTPGGPRPRKEVHRVRPGEVVRQNEDGTFSVVPKQDPDHHPLKPKKKDKD
jgi:hypothetical protein